MAWTDATDALNAFLVNRDLEARQAMIDRIALEDRNRERARLDAAATREQTEYNQRQADRVAAQKAATAAAEAEATKNRLLAMRQGSLNVAGSGDPSGAQATRDAIAVALRVAGAGKEADTGAAADLARAQDAAKTAAIQDYANAPTAQKAAVLKMAHGVDVPEPPKRDLRTVGDRLIEVTPGGVQTLYQAPAKGPSEATQLALDARRQALADKETKAAEAKAEKDAKAAAARETTQSALDTVNRLLDPKSTGAGIGRATGAYEMLGWTQAAEDFNADRDQLVATLTLPNLGVLKGPMSDKDVVFVKQIATKLANRNMSEKETRAELERARTFLRNKLATEGAAPGGAQNRRAGDDLGADWGK
jgi:hypothetical protein